MVGTSLEPQPGAAHVSHLERSPRQANQICPHMSPATFQAGVVLFEYDENLVFEHETLGFRARQVVTLKRLRIAPSAMVTE